MLFVTRPLSHLKTAFATASLTTPSGSIITTTSPVILLTFTDKTVAQNANTNFYGGIKTGTVGSLVPMKEYKYQWFNPINGEYSEEYHFTSTRFGTYYIGDRPQSTDMVLHISTAD